MGYYYLTPHAVDVVIWGADKACEPYHRYNNDGTFTVLEVQATKLRAKLVGKKAWLEAQHLYMIDEAQRVALMQTEEWTRPAEDDETNNG